MYNAKLVPRRLNTASFEAAFDNPKNNRQTLLMFVVAVFLFQSTAGYIVMIFVTENTLNIQRASHMATVSSKR